MSEANFVSCIIFADVDTLTKNILIEDEGRYSMARWPIKSENCKPIQPKCCAVIAGSLELENQEDFPITEDPPSGLEGYRVLVIYDPEASLHFRLGDKERVVRVCDIFPELATQ